MAPYEVHSHRSDRGSLAAVVPIGHIAIPPAEHAPDGDRIADRFTRPVDATGVGDREHRTEQRFTGNATPIGALTADEFAFYEDHRQARRPASRGDRLSDRPAAQHNHVIATAVGAGSA